MPKAIRFNEDKMIKSDEFEYVPGYDSEGKKTGYVVSVDTPGYGPSIKFVAGISVEGKITGIRITDASKETPGLGSKITDLAWQKNWKGRDINYEFRKETDAFAGATVSPYGVYKGIKKALNGFEAIKGGAE